jgi:hypothetical protein
MSPADVQYLTFEGGRLAGSGHDQERIQNPQRLLGAAR